MNTRLREGPNFHGILLCVSPRPPLSNEAMLHELLPMVEKALDRHVAATSEWFPHDYVPYEEGRNFVKEPWQPADSSLPDVAQTALEVNLLTEDNLPYYHLALWRTFGEDEAWGEWVRRWTAEEGRHAIVLRDYLTVTRGVDPDVLERGRMDQALRGWYPQFAEQGPLDGVVFTTIQELATRISHRNTGEITEDETAQKLCARVATDENFHYVFYRDMAINAIELDPSAVVLAMHRQILNFAMPGAGIPGFRQKAKAMAKAGDLQPPDPPRTGAAARVGEPLPAGPDRRSQRRGQAGARGDLRAPGAA